MKEIIRCFEKAISAFNRINTKYGGFIMTAEREEIVAFLTKGATYAGIKENIDI